MTTAPSSGRPSTSAPTSGRSSTSAPTSERSSTTAPEGLTLPRGGTTIFPTYRLVGYAGYPGSSALGRLGVGDLDARIREMEGMAEPYAHGRKILPVLELIATVVHPDPGTDGTYRSRIDNDVIKTYLAAARRHKALLLLNIQPGRADFLDEAKAYQKWLEQPDVGLALDPEWAVGPGQKPGTVFGSTTGAELDSVAAWTSRLVAAHHLPQKVIVYHQLHVSIVKKAGGLKQHPGIAMVASVDGIGNAAEKISTWKKVVAVKPSFVHPGFKLFFGEDRQHGSLMTAGQVMALKPTPEYVLYE